MNPDTMNGLIILSFLIGAIIFWVVDRGVKQAKRDFFG